MQWIRVNPERLAVVICLLAPVVLSAAEGARIVGESRPTAQRIAEAAAAARDGRIQAAVDIYVRILDDSGGELVEADEDHRRLLPARWVVHRRIAANDALLALFRERMNVPARQLLEKGTAARDPRVLKQLVESFFCARAAESALHMLGDLACESGDFAAARRYWSSLIPANAKETLVYPASAGDPAIPAAKIILLRLLAGERDDVAADIATYQRRYPGAQGALAGQTGNIAEILHRLAADPNLRVRNEVTAINTPTTFGGDESRNGILRVPWPAPAPEPPFAPIVLPEASPDSEGHLIQRPRIRPSALAFFPIVHARHALVSDARRVSAFDLATGRLVAQFDLKSIAGSLPRIDTRLPSATDARYTLTIAGDMVYARLGQPRIRSERTDADSYLVALQFRPNSDEKLKLHWRLPALKPEQAAHVVFEGAPLIHDRRLYVAVTKIDGNRALTAVECYDPTDTAPRLLWQRDLFETGPDAADRSGHLLLTAADGQIVCGPHAGAIVAIEAETGRRSWAMRYDSRGPLTDQGQSPSRELCPCVAADGRHFAAPADYDRIIALDAASGAPLWESHRIEVAHVLGVNQDKLICQTGGFVAGLCALDVTTGRRVPDWGYSVFGADSAAPFGRGLLFADSVLWPTRADGVKAMRLDGRLDYGPVVLHSLPGGNLVFGDGTFIAATAERLYALTARSEDSAVPGTPLGLLRRRLPPITIFRSEVP
jgi:outer membrane protein assembly factor BamB